MPYYSQYKQDAYLEDNVFLGFKNGFFVDVGSHDGKTLNNTLFFEETHHWSGINIEPIPKVYKQLVQNRPNCVNLCCAVSDEEGTSDFRMNTGYTEMLSGLVNHCDSRHKERMTNEIKEHGGETTIITVPTKRLETIFDEHNITHVHYLSIDVEGAEFAVLRGINFENVFIDVIEFENNYNDITSPILEFLRSKGYRILEQSSIDIIMIHKQSVFLKTD